MYVLAHGTVRIVRHLGRSDEQTVDRITDGCFFGEIGLVASLPRLASVVAEEDCMLLEVSRERVQALSAQFPSLEPVVQHFYKERLLANLLRSSPVLRGLSQARKRDVVDAFAARTVPAGTTLIRQGDAGQGLWVLLRGRCDVAHAEEGGRAHAYPSMAEGAVFGEIALLRGTSSTASVTTTESSLLLLLERDAFQRHLATDADVARMLKELTEERLDRTARAASTPTASALI